MFWKKKSQDIDLKELVPKAGNTRKFLTGEAVFFSPKPLPSAKIASETIVQSPEILEINDTYLDIGQRNQGKAWQVQIMSSGISVSAIVILLILFYVGHRDMQLFGSFFIAFLESFNDVAVSLTIAFFLLLCVSCQVIIGTSIDFARQRPIRLNRQRREICYYSDKEKKPIIAPWEEVVCWVALNRGTTGNSMVTHFTFGLAIPTPDGKDYWTLRRPIASVTDGQRMWETMRMYMDEPLTRRPEPSPFIKEDRAYFDKSRREMCDRFQKGPKCWFILNSNAPWVSYASMFFYYLFHILSGWKLPYWVSEWTDNLAKVDLPKEIDEWSKPIPESEWAKPSEELLRQRGAIEKHYETGGSIMDFNPVTQ
ncbi:DUF6708 domain-containing protein [Vibrio mimicus]|uniref:Uncharacterized protein n=1 Tax=Vibrio mimicus TaxID=674 RepID=A0A2J9VI02_VIBMI|nr:DUF6708 domain-containing protein [Vibrio mimicus]EEW10186.1 conserved hypothetical protein [Vibrio mimicus VM573]EGU19445.1 hypothetical protein SX4_2677 [Vibrio mimicus SX-4]KFE32752.1 hypothetical protein DN31_551 [Vibrio mimicus]PNM63419.1 hypothetical protein AL544_000100 [Vibrio mimicus]